MATASNDDFIFTVESVFSDGNHNYFAVSIEDKNGQEIGENVIPMITFRIKEIEESASTSISTIGSERINSPDNLKNKAYYITTISTSKDLIEKNIELNLNGFINTGMNVETENSLKKLEKGLSVSFNIGGDKNQTNIKTITIDESSIIDKKNTILQK